MSSLPSTYRTALCFLSLIASVQSLSCYSYAGREHISQKKCANSNACCSEDDECLSNRLCKSSGLAANLLIRGTCLNSPWDDSCAQICDFKEEQQNTGFPVRRFPQVEICDEGVYCCRFGNKPCCDEENNWVFLDEDGVRVSSRPSITSEGSASEESDVSSTEIEETTSSRTIESISTPSESPQTNTDTANETQESDAKKTESGEVETDEDDDGTDDNVGLKAGLGAGIPVAAGLAGLGAWWFWRRRRRQEAAETSQPSELPQEQYKGYAEYNGSPGMQTIERSELSGWNGNVPYELAGTEPQYSRGQ